jgi:hypothetical protein
MPGTISPERVSNPAGHVASQWLSRISTEKDTKKIVAKKEEYYFYYQLRYLEGEIRKKRGARSQEREGCTGTFPVETVKTVPLLLAAHASLLAPDKPDKLISCLILSLLGPVRPGVTARAKNHSRNQWKIRHSTTLAW